MLSVYQNRSVAYNEPMSIRRAKQLIYGALYLVLLVAFVAVIYFIVGLFTPKAPVAVSCTGECMPVGADSITTSTVQAFVSSPGHYTFLGRITNTNSDYAAEYFDYAIDLYDASGTVIQSIPGSSFVYASQTKYLMAPNVTVPAPFISAGIVISNVYWVTSATLGVAPQFSVENVTTNMASSTVSVSGQLTNSNIATFNYVYIDVIFTGSDGSPVAASQTELSNVAPNKTVDFSVLYPQTGGINPAANQILVYGLK